VKRIETLRWAHKRRNAGSGSKQRAKDRIKPVIQNGSERHGSQHQAKKQDGSSFHVIVSGGSSYISILSSSQNNFSSLNVGF